MDQLKQKQNNYKIAMKMSLKIARAELLSAPAHIII